jgi:hypothetical protein
MKNWSFFFFFSFFFLLVGCQTTPSASGPRLFAELYVRYLEDGQQIKAEASFLEGDSLSTAQSVDLPKGVSFLGSGMGERKLQGNFTRYQYENFGEYPSTMRFRARRSETEFTDFEASLSAIQSIDFPDTLFLGRAHAFSIAPDGLKEDQSLVLLLTDSTGKSIPVELSGPVKKGGLQLSPTQIEGMAPGKGSLYIVKKQTERKETRQSTSVFTIEYYSKSVEFWISKP